MLKVLTRNKRLWLPPFIIVTLLLTVAVLVAKGPAIIPFIYRTL
jgi:hypothetical protein